MGEVVNSGKPSLWPDRKLSELVEFFFEDCLTIAIFLVMDMEAECEGDWEDRNHDTLGLQGALDSDETCVEF